MAANMTSKDDEIISQVNIIPFVDISLVLLIAFMLTSTAIVKAAIKVELPKAASVGSDVNATVNVVLTRQKELLLDGESFSKEDAKEEIRRRATRNPELQAVVSADTRLNYGDVVEIVDMIKLAGVTTFALNIERKDTARI